MASVDVNSNNTIVTVTETGKEIVSIELHLYKIL